MIFYYSGDASNNPETLIKFGSLMMSYHYEKSTSSRLTEIKRERRMTTEELEAMEVGCVQSHFLDSGSYSLWTQVAAKYAKEHGCSQWDYYASPEFYQYMDDYATFVKKYKVAIDLYANVDVIPNPELSYRNQKYLERKHGLSPVPVVHFTTDLKWLRKYIDKGYELIGLGGLVGSTRQDGCRAWIDSCFNMVCDNKDRLPCVKLHGFGVTNYDLLLRYPWWSVDSTSWTKVAAYGGIYVPHKRRGEFIFNEQPYLVKTSNEGPTRKELGRHFHTMSRAEKAIICEWLDLIGIPLGTQDKHGEPLSWGVTTRHTERRAANLLFFERMRQSLPEWPWPFHSQRRKGFGFL